MVRVFHTQFTPFLEKNVHFNQDDFMKDILYSKHLKERLEYIAIHLFFCILKFKTGRITVLYLVQIWWWFFWFQWKEIASVTWWSTVPYCL